MTAAQNCARTCKQLQHTFQSARRSRSDVETDNAKQDKTMNPHPGRNVKYVSQNAREARLRWEECEVSCTECERSKTDIYGSDKKGGQCGEEESIVVKISSFNIFYIYQAA